MPEYATRVFLDIIRCTLIMVAILLALRIVWRSQQHLDTFFKYTALGLFFFLIGTVLDIFEYMGTITIGDWIQIAYVFGMACFIFGLLSFNRLIKKMDNER